VILLALNVKEEKNKKVYWYNIRVLLVEDKASVSNGKVKSATYCYLTNKRLSVQCL
jgi:hypothetical protein